MMELTVPAALEELEHVQEFVEQALEEQGVSMKIQMQISIAVEEIYVNIARYAYHPEIGQATVRCAVCSGRKSPAGNHSVFRQRQAI